MTPIVNMAKNHYIQASFEWCEATGKIAFASDEGEEVRAEDFNRLALAQFSCVWWRDVVQRIDHEELDGAEAILRTRRDAERSLLRRSICYGELFAQAMEQARRQAALQFLKTTQELADAVTNSAPSSPQPAIPATVPSTSADDAATQASGRNDT
ncbi:hypothetical protein Acor_40900 [Acrocarpospora corrugata]|uniref:Uncharacterized protein n=1 Tax=Acrocarpospora corrugata TaxID=35763 RepID=A0A5M3VYZ1_9ACTN|nr:hypothetical protein [Acrocarpospora corrugata]GES02025.1 hypothetical protein Acor_40900 [Acrocarpospora corrugata]